MEWKAIVGIFHIKVWLRLWDFDILFVYFFSCLFVPHVVLILQKKNGPMFLKKNYILYFVLKLA